MTTRRKCVLKATNGYDRKCMLVQMIPVFVK